MIDFDSIYDYHPLGVYYVASKMLQSVTKIMGKTAIRAISCFSPLPPLNNVEKQ